MNIYRLNTHRTRTFLVNPVSKPKKWMFLQFMLLFQGSGSLVTQLKKSYSLTDLTAADDEDDCDGGIQSTPRHAHYSNFFAYCLLFINLIIDGSLVWISSSAPSRLGVLMGVTRFGAEKSCGMVLDFQKYPLEPVSSSKVRRCSLALRRK